MRIALAAGMIGMATLSGLAVAGTDEVQAIKVLDAAWSKAAGQKDAVATVSFYAEDCVVLPQGEPIVKGRAKAQEMWANFMGLPGFAIHFEPTQIVVSKSRDMAYDIGTYTLTSNDAHGQPVNQVGKYLVTWKKDKQGAWKVMADMFNADK